MKTPLLLIISGFLSLNLSCQVTTTYTVQGTGKSSTYNGQTVTTEGVVTADFQESTELKGFFIQDISGDNNPATSDGIFIYDNLSGFNVNVGDLVRVTGAVNEYFGFTQIKDVTSIVIQGSGYSVAPVTLALPVPSVDSFERYESMLVNIKQPLTVIENYNLGRNGELLLCSEGRQMTATNILDPNDHPATGATSTGISNLVAIDSLNKWYARTRILLNDGSLSQNPDPVPYIDPVLQTLRCGSRIDTLTGVVGFSFGLFNIHPTVPLVFNFMPRSATPVSGGSEITVASFNVLNYFNGNGMGQGFPTARGANTLVEFNRQRAKIFEALKTLDADVVGLMEIERDGDGSLSAIADLVNGLNASIGVPGMYAAVPDPTGANGNPGSDAIKVAMIYKPGKVTLIGPSQADTSSVNSRNPLAQTIQINSDNEIFSVIVNHFKSKNCDNAAGLDLDQNDGQSCYNHKRKLQSGALLSFLEKVQLLSGDLDVLIIGDLNSNEQEDPIDTLRAYGLVSYAEHDYSYVFEGETGSLDHALSTLSFMDEIVSADVWHVNADEPHILDYNEEFNPPNLYQPNAYRSSDHDPLIVKIGFATPVSQQKENLEEGLFSIYPNPGGLFKLEFKEQGAKKIEVLDSNGKSLLTQEVNLLKSSVDLSNHPKGEYIIRALYQQSGKIQSKRVVVK